MERKVEFEISCIAIADAAIGISGFQTGNQLKLEGFLAKKGSKNGEIVFHTKHIELIG